MDTWRTGRRTITRTQVKVGYTRTRETRYHGTTPPPERHMALGTKGKTRSSIAFQCPAQRQLHSMHSTFALARFGELTVCYTEVLKVLPCARTCHRHGLRRQLLRWKNIAASSISRLQVRIESVGTQLFRGKLTVAILVHELFLELRHLRERKVCVVENAQVRVLAVLVGNR
jgi:hypothetical protein